MSASNGDVTPISEPPPIEIKITFNRVTGMVDVTGPINDKIMFFGLLAIAHERVVDHHREARAANPNIIPIRRLQ